jgi:hypothetical protein
VNGVASRESSPVLTEFDSDALANQRPQLLDVPNRQPEAPRRNILGIGYRMKKKRQEKRRDYPTSMFFVIAMK